MNERIIRDTRLLEALEFIDDEYIVSAARYKMKYEAQPAEPPKMTWRTPLKHWRQFAALAACILLLSMASPLVSYIAEVISNFNAGAGSTNTVDGTVDDFPITECKTYPLTQHELDAINKVWHPGKFAESIEDVGLLCGSKFIYGKYDNIIVLGWSGMTAEYSEFTVEGYLFKFPRSGGMLVYYEGNIYSMTEVYNKALFTDEQIEELWELHNVYILNNDEYLLTKSELASINAVWGENGFADNISEIERFGGAGSFIYGRFNDCIVLGKFSSDFTFAEYTVANCRFIFKDSVMKVYKDGKLYSLSDAYNDRILTVGSISQIHELHSKYILRQNGVLTSNQLKVINKSWGGNGFADRIEDVAFRNKADSFIYAFYNDNSIIVLGKVSNAVEHSITTVAGYIFELPSMEIKVFYENELLTLEEAYQKHLLTDNQIKDLWEVHTNWILN